MLTKIPDGFEIYENPNAQVFLRKKLESKITKDEIGFCKDELAKICIFNPKTLMVDYKQNEIIIHFSAQIADVPKPPKKVGLFHNEYEDLASVLSMYATYHPLLKFSLFDDEERLFIAERFCFLGGIDDWIVIGTIDSLENQVRKYGKHLGQESFFELS